MQFGSVCSGIEAASVAFAPLGWRAAWLAEIEPFPCAVLAHHYPDVPNLGDMTAIARRVLTGEVSAPDVLCGGTPCQAFSVAGLRQSLADERGNLSLKFVELADAIDHVRVRRGEDECIVFWENVPGVLSTRDNAFGCFLGGLAGEDGPLEPPGGKWANAGAVYGPERAVAWRLFDAQFFALAQRRRRVFVVASARKGFDPAAVLFEWDGVRRDTAPSREAGQGVTHDTAPCLTSSGRGVESTGDTRGQDPVVAVAFGGNNQTGPIDVATARNACSSASGPMDFDTETFLVQPAHTLRGEGFDASEDGTGRGTPLVPVGVTIHGTDPTVQKVASLDETAQCLRARTPGNIDNSSTTVVMQPVAFAENTRAEVRLEGGDGTRTGALSTGGGKPGQGIPCVAYGIRTANTSSNGWGIQEECTHTLDCAQGVAVAHTLRGEGFDASEDCTGRGTPLVPHVVGALACNTGPNGHDAGNFACNQAVDAGHVLPVAIVFDTTQITSAANRSNPKPGDACHPLAAGAHAPAIAFPANWNGNASTENISPALGALNPTAVAFSCKDYGAGAAIDLAPTMRAMGHAGSHPNAGGQLAVAQFIHANKGRPEGRHSAHTEMVSVKPLAETLTTDGHAQSAVFTPAMQVRRLTPTEAERLMGFPDGYTAIPWRKKPASECPDGPRYKSLGNSWAVPVARWIGCRIDAAVRKQEP